MRIAAAWLKRAALAGLLWGAASMPVSAEGPFRLITTDLSVPLVPNSVMELSHRLGYFERHGVAVEMVRVQHTPSAMAALLAGQGEMANVSTDALLQLVARHDRRLKAVISPNRALPFLIAARQAVSRPEMLPGRSFGIGRIGSLDHSLSSRVLRALGVQPGEVDFVAIGQPTVRARALAAGRIDATTMSIGVWLALPDKAGLHILVPQDAYYAAAPVVSKVNIVPAAVLARRRHEVVALVRALIEASRDFARDPSLWVSGIAKARPEVLRKDLEALAEAFAGGWSVDGGMRPEELEATAAFLHAGRDFAGLPRPALADWTDLSVVREALDGLPAPDDPSAGPRP